MKRYASPSRAAYILANPPFNDSDPHGELLNGNKTWACGVPSAGNANFAHYGFA